MHHDLAVVVFGFIYIISFSFVLHVFHHSLLVSACVPRAHDGLVLSIVLTIRNYGFSDDTQH